MRIGEFNSYRYIHISKLNNSASKVEKTNNEKNSSLEKKYESIDEYQRKAMKEIDNMKAKLNKADKEIKEMRDTSERELKCTIIARRIISGNKVPKADYIYLAENDSSLYQKAIVLRIQRDKPLKFKRISEYEKVKCYDTRKSYMENQEQPLYR